MRAAVDDGLRVSTQSAVGASRTAQRLMYLPDDMPARSLTLSRPGLQNAMVERHNDTFLIDGFPRAVEQALVRHPQCTRSVSLESWSICPGRQLITRT